LWAECTGAGYHKDAQPWLAVWLMILCDNTMYLFINYLSIRLLV
jgi:hypothetical protein